MIYALITISECWLPAYAILCEWSSHLNDCRNSIAKMRRDVKVFLAPILFPAFPRRGGAGGGQARIGLMASASSSFLAWASARSLPLVVK